MFGLCSESASSSTSGSRSSRTPSARSAGCASEIAGRCRRIASGDESPLAEDALDARIGVLQIGRRVAVHRHHLLPVEDVVADPVLAQVGVLDGTQSDDLGHAAAARRIELGAVLIDDLSSLGGRLVEQRLEADDVSFTRLVRAAIRAQDRAEGDVLEIDRVVAPLAGDLEKLLEVVALAVVDDVEDLVGVPGLDAILDRGQVGGGIGEGAVALADR